MAITGGLVLLSVVAVVGLAATHGSARDAAPPARPAETAAPPVASAPVRDGAGDFLGVVLARFSADVAPRIAGTLREMHVRLGDRVRKGSVLGSLDAPSLRFDLSIAEASAKSAGIEQERAEVELAEADEHLKRTTALQAQALVSGEALATAQYGRKRAAGRVEAARAQIAEKRARVEQLRQANADAEIRAPFDGIIAARYVDPGTNVTPAAPIVRLISTGDLFVRFAVPEGKIGSLTIGASVRVRAGEGSAVLHGSIDNIAPEIATDSRMLIVEAELDPTGVGTQVISGELARVSLDDER
jgi:RND family efflux transporter MFP subunit